MGTGGVCHECGCGNCECEYDPIESERNEFMRHVLMACRHAGVTIEFDFERAAECGIDGPSFVSAPLNEAGMGFVVDISDIEERLRLSS